MKWTETRSESLLSAHHGRDQIQDITIAAKRDGTVTGAEGRPARRHGRLPRLVTRASRSSARSCPTRSTSSRPTGSPARTCSPTRPRPTPTAAPGGRRPRSPSSGSWTSWRSSSAATRWSCASRTGSSTRSSRSPRSCGLDYDSGNYEAATAKAEELFDYDGLRREQQQRRESGDPVQLGIGISTFTEMCGLAPSRLLGSLGVRRGRLGDRVDPDAAVRQGRGRHRLVRRTGRATRRPGARSSRTSSACRSRTSRCCTATPRSRREGLDTYGSRSLAVGGIAVVKAAEKVVAKARKVAAHLLEASEDDLEFSGGRFGVKGTGKGVTIQEVAYGDLHGAQLPRGRRAVAGLRRTPSTRRTSRSRTARTSPRWRSTPRPAG